MKKSVSGKIVELFATFFYVGYAPLGPGTAASVVTTILFFFLPNLNLFYTVFLWAALFFFGVWVSTIMERNLKIKDASCIVIDEVLGMIISLFMIPKSITLYIVALCFFRFFDIVKPFPVSFFEQKCKAGWGIMLDDVMAGIFTMACMFIVRVCFL